MAAFCSQSDLEIAVGGADVLRQLADPSGTGTADSATVTDYLEGPAGKIRSAIEIKHDPETIATLDAGTLRTLRDCNKWLSAEVAWLEGARGQGMPQHIAARAAQEREWLSLVADGHRRLGRVAGKPGPALNQPAGVIDFDSLGTGVSVAGFKRGFR